MPIRDQRENDQDEQAEPMLRPHSRSQWLSPPMPHLISYHFILYSLSLLFDYEEITYLLSKSPNQASKDGALFYAASHGKLAELQALLQHRVLFSSIF